jgi:hypothetical protein
LDVSLIIVTKEEINRHQEQEKDSRIEKTWKTKRSKLTSPVTRTSQAQSPWQQQPPLMLLSEQRYSRKPHLLHASSFSPDLYIQRKQGEAT